MVKIRRHHAGCHVAGDIAGVDRRIGFEIGLQRDIAGFLGRTRDARHIDQAEIGVVRWRVAVGVQLPTQQIISVGIHQIALGVGVKLPT